MLLLLACTQLPEDAPPIRAQASEADCPDHPYTADICLYSEGDLGYLWEGDLGEGVPYAAAWGEGSAQLSIFAEAPFPPGELDLILPGHAVRLVWHGASWCRYDGACTVEGASGSVTVSGTLVEGDTGDSGPDGTLNFVFTDIALETGSTIRALSLDATFGER